MGAPVAGFSIIPIIRVIGVTVTALVLIWAVRYRGGLALVSDRKDLIFNVHPVLMVFGLILLNGEGGCTSFLCELALHVGLVVAIFWHHDKNFHFLQVI
ncbi:transmembrane ascorbate ferrireductase 2-like [Syzygium oleosum]|uniref:transmembrane ascorbate ferrireductase 2-like n=1 Tax=Syzygium oleosum TaxID=219896 RepID=UPI0024B95994|nr:transmembrane ascorbate ferrireductase 2-like [Syzygium oleosum]